MHRLTRLQLDRLESRISETLGQLRQREIQALGPQPIVPAVTSAQLLDLIRRGKAKLKDDVCPGTALQYAFVLPTTVAARKARQAYETWKAKVEEIQAKYAKEMQRLLDVAYLGDSAEALQLLQTLELKLQQKK